MWLQGSAHGLSATKLEQVSWEGHIRILGLAETFLGLHAPVFRVVAALDPYEDWVTAEARKFPERVFVVGFESLRGGNVC